MLPNADAACIVTRCDARPTGAIARGPTALVTEGTVNATCETYRVRLGGCRSREYQRKRNSEHEAHIVVPIAARQDSATINQDTPDQIRIVPQKGPLLKSRGAISPQTGWTRASTQRRAGKPATRASLWQIDQAAAIAAVQSVVLIALRPNYTHQAPQLLVATMYLWKHCPNNMHRGMGQ